ncbi:hypothetical protein IPH92_03675 [Candidatus Kaiserbacteria bacterium]|nr:MAG: hypothetical protein IPH92_03675 [Candidatus Kaiserbacteria bacterium]
MSADKVKVVSSPVIPIGGMRGRGIVVTMTRSRSNRFALIKEEFGNGDHIALATEGGVKWADHPDVCGVDLLLQFMNMKRANPGFMNGAFWKIFPEYDNIPLSEFGLQPCSNDAISGTRDDIHAHIVLARKEVWDSGAIPRFVDPIDPVPLAERKPREK